MMNKYSQMPTGRIEKYIDKSMSFYDKSNRCLYTATAINSPVLREMTKSEYVIRSKQGSEPVSEYITDLKTLAIIMWEISRDLRKWRVGNN